MKNIVFVSTDEQSRQTWVDCAEIQQPGLNASSVSSVGEIGTGADVCVIEFPLSTFKRGWIVNGIDQVTLIPKNIPVLLVVASGTNNGYWLLDQLTFKDYHNVYLAGWGLWDDIVDVLVKVKMLGSA